MPERSHRKNRPQPVYPLDMSDGNRVIGFACHEVQGIIPINLVAEEELVRSVCERIGYGRTMQLCEELWGPALVARGLPPGGSKAVTCCTAFLVPCPGQEHARGEGSKCDWCCGAGRVTKKVAWAMSRLEPPT